MEMFGTAAINGEETKRKHLTLKICFFLLNMDLHMRLVRISLTLINLVKKSHTRTHTRTNGGILQNAHDLQLIKPTHRIRRSQSAEYTQNLLHIWRAARFSILLILYQHTKINKFSIWLCRIERF